LKNNNFYLLIKFGIFSILSAGYTVIDLLIQAQFNNLFDISLLIYVI